MKIIIALILTITLFSCNQKPDKQSNTTQIAKENENTQINSDVEKFKVLDSDKINKLLESKNEELSPQDVIKLYYPVDTKSSEGNEEIKVSEVNIENGNTLVTLIHDNLLDDSQKGEKYIMELKKANNRWRVISIKMNWKCWDGRGHTDWGIEFCK